MNESDCLQLLQERNAEIAALKLTEAISSAGQDAQAAAIAILYQKLAAAESNIALYQSLANPLRQLGFVELGTSPPAHLVVGQLKNALDYYKSEMQRVKNQKQANADFRAAVAVALAELRAQWVCQIAYYQTRQKEPDYAERLAELEYRLREFDATIAKLDLQEQPQ